MSTSTRNLNFFFLRHQRKFAMIKGEVEPVCPVMLKPRVDGPSSPFQKGLRGRQLDQSTSGRLTFTPNSGRRCFSSWFGGRLFPMTVVAPTVDHGGRHAENFFQPSSYHFLPTLETSYTCSVLTQLKCCITNENTSKGGWGQGGTGGVLT